MRRCSRLILGLCGLALAVPALPRAAAAPPYDNGTATVMPAGPQGAPAPPAPAPAPHPHKGLFGWRHCVECQRAYVQAHDGVYIPPPPGYPGAAGMPVQGGTMVAGPMMVNDPRAAGYAVVGPGGAEMPGYAVVGGSPPGADPTPIGVARATPTPWADPRLAWAAHRPGAGPYDPSLVPTSLPPSQVARTGPGHDRPHVISHLFGLPIIGRHHRERQEKRREQHAAIAYGDTNQKVSELPASMVYGRR